MIAIIAILAAMLLPALSRAKAHAYEVACINNFNQLSKAWHSYSADSGDRFVDNRPDGETNSWVYGVLNFQAGNTDNTNILLLTTGQLAENLAKNHRIFKCPADPSKSPEGQPRARSCSMNQYMGAGLQALGGFQKFEKSAQLHNPSELWVFADEHPDSINDGCFMVDMIDTEAWTDLPASFHNGAGVLAYADGHVQAHAWRDASTKPPAKYEIQCNRYKAPGSQDRRWFLQRTTLRSQ